MPIIVRSSGMLSMLRSSDRPWGRLVSLLAPLGLLVACGGTSPPPAPENAPSDAPRRGGTAVVALSADLAGVNPLVSGQSRLSGDLQRRLFASLFEERPDFASGPPSFGPALAERWSWSADHRELLIELRTNARWSDGRPVTAADVVWTWERQVDAAVAWRYAQSKESILAVEALAPHRVRVRFRHAYPGQLTDLNEGPILPRHAWSDLPAGLWQQRAEWFRDHLVTSGPFTLAEWRAGERLVLERNPLWYEEGLPRLDRVVFQVLPDKASQLAHLSSGVVDLVDQVPPDRAAALAARPDLELLSYWPRQYDFICWNTTRPLFADPEIRRALTLAIDRTALIDALWHGYARVGVGPILRSVWAVHPELEPWPYDPQAARRILERHGWIDSDDNGTLDRRGRDFHFTLLTNASSEVRHDAALMIQQQLARVDIRMEIRSLEFNTLAELSERHDFDAQIGAWAIDTSLDLAYAFHSDSIEGGYNFGGYANPEVDALIDRFNRAPDARAALPLLHRLQEILHREQPYTFLWEPQRLVVIDRALRDVEPDALSTFSNLRRWWLAPPG